MLVLLTSWRYHFFASVLSSSSCGSGSKHARITGYPNSLSAFHGCCQVGSGTHADSIAGRATELRTINGNSCALVIFKKRKEEYVCILEVKYFEHIIVLLRLKIVC